MYFEGFSIQRSGQCWSGVTASKPPLLPLTEVGLGHNGYRIVALSFGQTIPVSCRQLVSRQQTLQPVII